MRLVPLLLVALTTPALAKPCQLRFGISAAPLPDGQIKIEAFVVNLTKRQITISTPERCPAGPIAFEGFRTGYDFYRTCTMGACKPLPRTKLRTVRQGRTVLAGVTIDPTGGSCNTKLDFGSYPVSFPKPKVPAGIEVCGAFATDVMLAKPAPGPEPIPPKPAPPPGPKKPYQCENIQACGIACPPGSDQARDEQGCPVCACEKPALPD